MGTGRGNVEVSPKTNQEGMSWEKKLGCTWISNCEAAHLATIMGSSSWRVSFAVNLLFMKLDSGRAFRSSPGLSR